MPVIKAMPTSWNTSIENGVAPCLLDNWVEERAVQSLVTDEKHKPRALLNRGGHSKLLEHSHAVERRFESTTKMVHREPDSPERGYAHVLKQHSPSGAVPVHPGPKAPSGTRRAIVERAMWELAAEEAKREQQEQFKQDTEVTSTYEKDFHKEFQQDDFVITEEMKRLAEQPYTVYHQQREESKLYTSSARRAVAKQTVFLDSFGKTVDFSTPIEHYLKGSTQL